MDRTDYAFPFRIDAASHQGAQTNYEAHVDQMIRQVLLTAPGERADLPEFGCGLRQLIFAPNRRRLAGYESYVPAPEYTSIDLQIAVCAQANAFRGDVEAAVLVTLSASKFPDGSTGFFYFDRFTFGTPLERSALEAALQRASGVDGVVSIRYRQRGVTSVFIDLPDTLQVAADHILRVDNDRSNPERGALQVIVKGGK